MNTTIRLAECVGLWLAEGDNKSNYEITFSNNCWDLVAYFHNTLSCLFKEYKPNIRIYVYEPKKINAKVLVKDVQINYYSDNRATKPYYIWRLASVELMRKWKRISLLLQNCPKKYPGILRGFFAGEGSVKEGTHCSRAIRISQAKRISCIDNCLNSLGIQYSFSEHHREGYVIRGRENLEILAKIGIASLHPIKAIKFSEMMGKYKQRHFEKGYLKNKIIDGFYNGKIFTKKQLSVIFERSPARIYDVLSMLKKEMIIENFRVKSSEYWIIKTKKAVIISHLKYKYLNILMEDCQHTNELAEKMGVSWKTAFNRLNELEKIGLVKRNENKIWEIAKSSKKVIVI